MFSTPQLAKRLSPVSVRTIENWRISGQGPPFVKAGRRVLYQKSAIQRWLSQRTKTRTTTRAPRER